MSAGPEGAPPLAAWLTPERCGVGLAQAIQTFTAGMWQYPKDPDFPKLKHAAESMCAQRSLAHAPSLTQLPAGTTQPAARGLRPAASKHRATGNRLSF